MHYADGATYEGEYKAGKKEGRGKYTWGTRKVYEGEWRAGNRDGRGSMRNPNGDTYEGLARRPPAPPRLPCTAPRHDPAPPLRRSFGAGEYRKNQKYGRGTYTCAEEQNPSTSLP